MSAVENTIMAHRYLYYVLAEPVLSDFIYDALEADARRVLPPESPVHGVGSSLPSSYSADAVDLARKLLGGEL